MADHSRPRKTARAGPKCSYGFWQRSLGGADVLGKRSSLGGSSYTIVGITGRKARELDPYFEVSAFEFVTVPIVLALIALVSVWLPARRASRVNPLEALRYE